MRLATVCGAVIAALSIVSPRPAAADAAWVFAKVVDSPPLLRGFLARMPKGGDLHNHLSGAAYAEANIRAAAAEGDCVNPETAQVSRPPCAAPNRPIGDALHDTTLHRKLVDNWSMRDFVPTSGNSGHDHFFATFGLFNGAAPVGTMAAEVTDRAAHQRMRYIELMVTFQGNAVRALADDLQKTTPWRDDDPGAFHAALIAAGLPAIVESARKDIDKLEARMRSELKCGTPQARPGCGMTVRWLEQVTRTQSAPRVYAASLFGALLSAADKRVVGLDFVAPEDELPALEHYTEQMRMLDYLYKQMPATRISLHAGELTIGLVRPEDLRFHIREAVELGHAKRIGHGVDVMYEDDAFGLLKLMADRKVTVEINLTSNAQILGVAGADHPFPVYMRAGVPTVLSTDDEGIERVDRTHELQRAVATYRLTWPMLLALERNTLEYAFVEGDSLWADLKAVRMVPACAGQLAWAKLTVGCTKFLDGSTKARLQWELERDLLAFEGEAATMLAPLR